MYNTVWDLPRRPRTATRHTYGLNCVFFRIRANKTKEASINPSIDLSLDKQKRSGIDAPPQTNLLINKKKLKNLSLTMAKASAP